MGKYGLVMFRSPAIALPVTNVTIGTDGRHNRRTSYARSVYKVATNAGRGNGLDQDERRENKMSEASATGSMTNSKHWQSIMASQRLVAS